MAEHRYTLGESREGGRAGARGLLFPGNAGPVVEKDLGGLPLGKPPSLRRLRLERQATSPLLTHRLAFHLDAVSVVDQAVEDGVGEGRVPEGVVPLLDR